MRLLITGGAGFIGSNYLEHALRQNHKFSAIRVIDALTYSGTETNFNGLNRGDFEFIQGDIRDEEFVARSTKEIDVIVHFAAESHVDRSINSSRIFVETNVVGTETLLNSALKNGIKTFVHISTDEVYGSIKEGSWTEEYPVNPNSPYAASKASSDLIALAFHRTHALDVRVTRCSNNYGPRQFPEKIIPLFVTNLLEGRKVPLYGNGKNIRDWLHVSDHCRAIDLVLNNGEPGEIYNIGGGRELSNNELTKLILREMNRDDSWVERVPDRKGHDFRYSLDIGKIARQLNYEPQVTFEEGIKETIQWYIKNEAWWKPLKNS